MPVSRWQDTSVTDKALLQKDFMFPSQLGGWSLDSTSGTLPAIHSIKLNAPESRGLLILLHQPATEHNLPSCSFADYFNPENTNFGALRVCNDDLVKAKSGFGWAPI